MNIYLVTFTNHWSHAKEEYSKVVAASDEESAVSKAKEGEFFDGDLHPWTHKVELCFRNATFEKDLT